MSDDRSEHGRWIRAAVDRFEGPLVRYAARITGDLESGRDVVQDTFVRLCKEDRQQLDGHLAQWLFAVCRNRALDVSRKENRMKTMTVEQAHEQECRETKHSESTEQRDATDHVLRLLERLPANQQEVMRLKFQNGLSYREISHITSLSISNVGYLLHTAIQTIRKELNVECS